VKAHEHRSLVGSLSIVSYTPATRHCLSPRCAAGGCTGEAGTGLPAARSPLAAGLRYKVVLSRTSTYAGRLRIGLANEPSKQARQRLLQVDEDQMAWGEERRTEQPLVHGTSRGGRKDDLR
jgi:hypothetical protein